MAHAADPRYYRDVAFLPHHRYSRAKTPNKRTAACDFPFSGRNTVRLSLIAGISRAYRHEPTVIAFDSRRLGSTCAEVVAVNKTRQGFIKNIVGDTVGDFDAAPRRPVPPKRRHLGIYKACSTPLADGRRRSASG